jgi:Asp-tRNA(Asn)/Glu-tRNA(Gln) amidotransferase A subunit family amidase
MTAGRAAAGEELAFSSLTDAAALLRAGKISAVELVRACLGRIEAHNPVLNAFITVTAESALQEACAADAEMRRGEWRGPLHGIPVAIKDMIDTAGVRTTAASAVHLDRIPGADAAVISRLRRAGAILLGKLNMQEARRWTRLPTCARASMLRNTRPFNGFGIPTVTVPCGWTDEDLPIGLQFAAGPWQERRVLALALVYESATAWHTRHPGCGTAA